MHVSSISGCFRILRTMILFKLYLRIMASLYVTVRCFSVSTTISFDGFSASRTGLCVMGRSIRPKLPAFFSVFRFGTFPHLPTEAGVVRVRIPICEPRYFVFKPAPSSDARKAIQVEFRGARELCFGYFSVVIPKCVFKY